MEIKVSWINILYKLQRMQDIPKVKTWGSGDQCPACNKTVYPTDRVRGARLPWFSINF